MERPGERKYCPMTQWVLDYIARTYGVQPEYLWVKTPDYAALRHPGNGKWFAVLMLELPRQKLRADRQGNRDVINLKCDPVMKGSVVDDTYVFPAYHMNKEHWISVALEEDLPKETIAALIDISYAKIDQKKRR